LRILISEREAALSQHASGKKALESDERRATIVAWLVVAALVLIMLANGFLALFVIGNRSETFQYRTAPLVPAEAYSSSEAASTSTQAPKQVDLPPAVVGKKAK
jgi:hypothetical protein